MSLFGVFPRQGVLTHGIAVRFYLIQGYGVLDVCGYRSLDERAFVLITARHPWYLVPSSPTRLAELLQV